MKNVITLSFIILLIANCALATTYTSVRSGNWNDPANWSPSGVPNVTSAAAWPGDNVIIQHQMTYTGNLTTAKKASITINSGGSLAVSGTLDIANTSPSAFTVSEGASLTTGNLTISSCCNVVTLAGDVTTTNFTFSASMDLHITGNIMVNGNMNASGGNSIHLEGALFSVSGTTTYTGSVKLYITNRAEANFNTISLTGDADIVGTGNGGVLQFNSISLDNPSTRITCASSMCNFSGPNTNTSLSIPNPLDLETGTLRLPVVLMYFNAKAESGYAQLNWATAQESNSDYFTLESSTDGVNFFFIGEIKAAGQSAQRTDYQFLTKLTSTTVQYFRLRQFDFDGTMHDLGIESITLSYDKIPRLVGSNIVQPGTQLAFDYLPNATQLYLVNAAGQVWPLSVNDINVALPSQLIAGYYRLLIKSDNEYIANIAVIIAD